MTILRSFLTIALCALLASHAPAQDSPATPEPDGEANDGFSLIQEGARMLLRGLLTEMEPAIDEMGKALENLEPAVKDLMALIDDIRNYEAPRMLDNGDILIPRRKGVPPSLKAPQPPGDTEIDL